MFNFFKRKLGLSSLTPKPFLVHGHKVTKAFNSDYKINAKTRAQADSIQKYLVSEGFIRNDNLTNEGVTVTV